MRINDYCKCSKSFHGLQKSNLNIQELFMHFVIVLSQLFNYSIKPNNKIPNKNL